MSEEDNNSQNQKIRFSRMAIWSLLLGILGFLTIVFVAINFYIEKGFLKGLSFLTILLIAVISTPLAFVLGMISIFKIRRNRHQLKGVGLSTAGILICIVSVTIITFGVIQIRALFYQVWCARGLEGFGPTMILYANDNDGKYPTSDKWCDLLLQGDYVTKEQFKCPRDQKGPCSYAINKNIVGMKLSDVPSDCVVLFESTPGWNQVGGPEILTTENHGGKGCNVMFCDFDVEFVKTEKLGKLKWKVEEGNSGGKGFSK